MEIYATDDFISESKRVFSDAEYERLEETLKEHPDLGKLIKGGGGIRKIRWKTEESGTRGGVRVIYYWADLRDQILMLMVYSKKEKADLKPQEIRYLRSIVEVEYQ